MTLHFNPKHLFPLPTEYFPEISQSLLITDACREVKAITQAPDSMIYMTALSAVSQALQGLFDVELPIGKIIPVSIMALTIAESGERKSAIENLFSKGLKLYQKENTKIYKQKFKRYHVLSELHKKRIRLLNRSVDLEDEAQCEQLANDLIALEEKKPAKPKLNFLVFEDSTIEAVLSKLSENVPLAFLGSSEGGVFLNSRAILQTAIFNAIWSGDDVNVDRKSEKSYILESARLTVHIMTQWSALERFLKKSKDDMRGNGFWSRFLVCAPISNCGYRQNNGEECSKEVLQEFNYRVFQLLSKTAELPDYKARKVVRFSIEAKRIWFDIYNDIEFKMRPGGIYHYAKDHASKLPENIARLAALIHCFDESSSEDISASTLIESINLVAYFSGEFMKVFCAPPKYVVDAQNLMQWFSNYANSGVRYIKRNDILQIGPNGTRKKKELDTALDYLSSEPAFSEVVYKRTKVIDLWPHNAADEAKLKVDLSITAW